MNLTKSLLALIPFLAGIAALFGAYYFFVGLRAVKEGGGIAAGLFVVHGVLGIGMGAILWREHRKIRRRMRGESDE